MYKFLSKLGIEFLIWQYKDFSIYKVVNGTRLKTMENKSGKTINQNYFKGLNYFKNLKSDAHLQLIYGGEENQTRTNYTVNSIFSLPKS